MYYVKRVNLIFRALIMCLYYVKWVNISRSLLFHVNIYVCVPCMLRELICQGVYYFMCYVHVYVCTMYVKSVNMSRNLLFYVFIPS